MLQPGDTAAALTACSAATQANPAAVWAWRRLGFLRLATGEPEPAITAFQTALRGGPRHVRTWEGLGAAYQALGRLTAALKVRAAGLPVLPAVGCEPLCSSCVFCAKAPGRARVREHRVPVCFSLVLTHRCLRHQAYGRALELDPERAFCHAQSGAVQVALGLHAPAAASFTAALALVPGHPPALLGAGQALLSAAQQHLVQGAPGESAGCWQVRQMWVMP